MSVNTNSDDMKHNLAELKEDLLERYEELERRMNEKIDEKVDA